MRSPCGLLTVYGTLSATGGLAPTVDAAAVGDEGVCAATVMGTRLQSSMRVRGRFMARHDRRAPDRHPVRTQGLTGGTGCCTASTQVRRASFKLEPGARRGCFAGLELSVNPGSSREKNMTKPLILAALLAFAGVSQAQAPATPAAAPAAAPAKPAVAEKAAAAPAEKKMAKKVKKAKKTAKAA